MGDDRVGARPAQIGGAQAFQDLVGDPVGGGQRQLQGGGAVNSP
jgi:hypothetical protein